MSFWSTKKEAPKLKRDGTLYANATFQDILHMWVLQKQAEFSGRGALSFKGPRLYSYQAHIATVYPRQAVVLISPYNWSQTTSGHCSWASHGARKASYTPYHYGPTREVMQKRAIEQVITAQERIVSGHKSNCYYRYKYLQDKIIEINEMFAKFGEKPLPPLCDLDTGMSFKLAFHERYKLVKQEALVRKLTGRSNYL